MGHAKAIFALLVLAGIILVAALFLSPPSDAGTSTAKPSLVVFCAAGVKEPVSRIASQYEKEYGVPIQLQYAGSGTLLSSLDLAKADIYLAADSSYTDIAREKGLVKETMLVSYLTAGLGVPTGNPNKITSLDDLDRPGLRIGIANPDAASVGKFANKILSRHGYWDNLNPHVFLPTVNELANALKLGTIDAAILWDAVANQYSEIDFVHVPEFDTETKDITVGVLTSSSYPAAALKFCRYLTARDRGVPVFAAAGYQTITDADVWKETP